MLGRATSRHLVVCGQFHRKGRHAARPAAHQLRTGCRESPNPWRSSGSPRSAGDGACGMPCRLLPSRREQQIAVARRAYPAQVEIADRAECWYPCSHRGRPVAAAPLSRASRLAAASRARDRRQAARSHPPETCLRYYARLFDEAPEHPVPAEEAIRAARRHFPKRVLPSDRWTRLGRARPPWRPSSMRGPRDLPAPDESPLPDSNRRPLPYHGSALPTELRGRRN
jgi:hypothetical protein